MKKNKKEKELILIISSFFVGCMLTFLFLTITRYGQTTIIKNGTSIYDKTSLAPSIEKIYNATVTIETYEGSTPQTSGSGFIYKIDNQYAYILTNEHVLSGNDIIVITMDEDEVEGKLLGKDPYLDLAVIRIEKTYAKQIATIGDSSTLEIGDTIFIVGSPLSRNYKGSVTSGIVSGKNRMVKTTVGKETSGNWIMNVIQVDASINSGNSGGPVLNVNGEVIGICTMKLLQSDIEGMGFAIPIETAWNNIERLEEGKEIEPVELGISMTNLSNASQLESNDINVPENVTEGIAILSVKENSTASTAKLKKGDIIIEIDGIKVKDTTYVKYVLFQHKIGDKIEVKYIRNGKEKKSEITLK